MIKVLEGNRQLLITPAAVSLIKAPQAETFRIEMLVVWEDLAEGSMSENNLAVGELPGEDRDDRMIMPCGDPVEEKKEVGNQ